MQSLAAHALELEVLIARCARRGWLDLPQLLDTYVRLAPTGHRLLQNPRKVDVDAVVKVLKLLPAEVFDAERLLVVPRLDAYPHFRAVNDTGMRAGTLSDGTLLVEAPLGLVSVTNLAAALCLLQHEIDKADLLLPPELRRPEADAEADTWDEEEDSRDDEAAAALAEFEAQLADEEEAEPEESPGEDEEAEDWSEEAHGDDHDHDNDHDHDGESTIEGQNEADDLLAHLAFAWGTDPTTIGVGEAETGGALLRALLRQSTLPDVEIHADLDPSTIYARNRARGQRVVATVAEMGLATRPLHLWLGNSVVTDCLSPYPRELRDVLMRWAAARPSLVGEDISSALAGGGEDLVYAISHDFLASDQRLAEERAKADRTVGVMRYAHDDLPFEVIDLARVDPNVCDARIASWDLDPEAPAPVLLRLPIELGDPNAGVLRGILETLGANVLSVTVVLEGSVFSAQPGTVVLPHLMVRWAGEQKLSLPTAASLDADDLGSYTASGTQRGAVLSVPSASLISAERVGELRRELNVTAVEVGGAGALYALNDALWSGQLASGTRISWLLVGMQRSRSGRPSVPSLAGLSAIAIAHLRAISAPDREPEPVEEVPPPPAEPLPRRPSPRAIRIKA